MATKAKTAKVETYTLEEAEKMLKARKAEAKAAREKLRKTAGFHVGTVDADDTAYNRLAVGDLSDGSGHLVRCSATMENAEGSVIVNTYPHGIFHRGCFARGASVDAAADAMAAMLADLATAWHATGKGSLRDGLAREYAKNAKGHTFNARPAKE